MGFACEHVVAVDLVTADGDLIRADNQQNTDLFWAARGAGPGFPGVVTRFHVQTWRAPKSMRSSGYIYPISHYRKALKWILKVSALPRRSQIGLIRMHTYLCRLLQNLRAVSKQLPLEVIHQI
jgi:hypothetical protein